MKELVTEKNDLINKLSKLEVQIILMHLNFIPLTSLIFTLIFLEKK